MTLAYGFARSVFARSLTPGLQFETEGMERIPAGGAVLICNHSSDADPGILMRAIPQPVGFLAAAFMGKLPIFRTLLRQAGSVAIGSTTPAPWREQVLKNLQSGKKLVIFPEGQDWLLAQDFDAEIAQFHPGFASFAHAARVPVVPMVIERLEVEVRPFKTSTLVRKLSDNPEELSATKKVMRYRRCRVHVLEPIGPERFVELPKDEAVPWLVEEARERMLEALR